MIVTQPQEILKDTFCHGVDLLRSSGISIVRANGNFEGIQASFLRGPREVDLSIAQIKNDATDRTIWRRRIGNALGHVAYRPPTLGTRLMVESVDSSGGGETSSFAIAHDATGPGRPFPYDLQHNRRDTSSLSGQSLLEICALICTLTIKDLSKPSQEILYGEEARSINKKIFAAGKKIFKNRDIDLILDQRGLISAQFKIGSNSMAEVLYERKPPGSKSRDSVAMHFGVYIPVEGGSQHLVKLRASDESGDKVTAYKTTIGPCDNEPPKRIPLGDTDSIHSLLHLLEIISNHNGYVRVPNSSSGMLARDNRVMEPVSTEFERWVRPVSLTQKQVTNFQNTIGLHL